MEKYGLDQERNLHRSSSVYKLKQSKTDLNKYVGGFWCERQHDKDFFTGESIIMDLYFFLKCLKKHLLCKIHFCTLFEHKCVLAVCLHNHPIIRAAAGQMGALSRIVLLCPLPQILMDVKKKTIIGVKIELFIKYKSK